MKKRIFTGAATALVTPMNADGSVNFGRLKTLVDEQIDGGIDALVICGTTGEKSTLRYDEHLRVIEDIHIVQLSHEKRSEKPKNSASECS